MRQGFLPPLHTASRFLLCCFPSIVFENNTHFYLLLCFFITPQRPFILRKQASLNMYTKSGTPSNVIVQDLSRTGSVTEAEWKIMQIPLRK